ncbi:MAG: glycosyltransferase family protein [Candidatus Acidiferrales bacterium]
MKLRDVIVLSGWNWQTFNVPERMALAFAKLGAKVLYCENPVSRLRHRGRPLSEIETGIYGWGPEFLGHRINRIPFGSRLQAKFLADRIAKQAGVLKLEDSIVVCPHGEWFGPLCTELKKKNFSVVHVCMDYPEPGQEKLIELSDLTLVIPRSVFYQLNARYGEKIVSIPQVTQMSESEVIASAACNDSKVDEIPGIPRPRLGYLGPVTNRLNTQLLAQVLSSRPDWHFIHFGADKCLPIANVHAIPWREAKNLGEVIANLDVGFMPYDCYDNKNFHCMPLKLFDYFSKGIPVVSTPIVNLWEFADTVYFGHNADGLCRAVQFALDEPEDSPKRCRRLRIARDHSIDALSAALGGIFSARGSTRP